MIAPSCCLERVSRLQHRVGEPKWRPVVSWCLVTSWLLRSPVCPVSEHVQTGHASVCSCPLCSLPVCLQSRPCRATPSWSWRAAPWPLSHPGMASWRPVSQFPRSRGKTGRARARAVLSVCDPPAPGGVCFAGSLQPLRGPAPVPPSATCSLMRKGMGQAGPGE